MGNKTIYVKDEELWNEAKRVAGKDGLSKLIAEALENYLKGKKAESAGETEYRLIKSDPKGPTPVVFTGRQLAQCIGGYRKKVVALTVYRTKGGKLILTDSTGNTIGQYGVYSNVDELSADPHLHNLTPSERGSLLDELRQACGEDNTVRIE